MKAIVMCFRDANPGATANEFELLAEVVYVGSDVPGGVLISRGAAENGVPITLNIVQLAQYADRMEDALIADAVRLGLPTLARTDCLFPTYQRGA